MNNDESVVDESTESITSDQDKKQESIDENLEKETSSFSDENLQKETSSLSYESNKRASLDVDMIVPKKKKRSEPKPQIIEDMKSYVEKDSLKELTNITMINWLRNHDVYCKTRDRKDVLIEKVKNFFLNDNNK